MGPTHNIVRPVLTLTESYNVGTNGKQVMTNSVMQKLNNDIHYEINLNNVFLQQDCQTPSDTCRAKSHLYHL